jgi:hypothetical protein
MRWVHIVPLVHLLVCFTALSGYIVPQLQWLGILFSVLVIADFPISGVYIAIAVGKYGAFAVAWLFVAGTLWWYFLCRTAERASAALKTRRRNRESLS